MTFGKEIPFLLRHPPCYQAHSVHTNWGTECINPRNLSTTYRAPKAEKLFPDGAVCVKLVEPPPNAQDICSYVQVLILIGGFEIQLRFAIRRLKQFAYIYTPLM